MSGAVGSLDGEEAAFRSVLQSWSTLDQATKDIIKTIVESRASTR